MSIKYHKSKTLGKFEYNTKDWMIDEKNRYICLRYIGDGKRVILPEGCINCRFMFSEYEGELDLSDFNTAGVIDMSCMFINSNITNIDLGNFNTESVTQMLYMFANSSVEELDLCKFKTNNLQVMNSMFSRCKNLKRVDLSSFNTDKVTHFSGLFAGCMDLEFIDIGNFVINNRADISFMFHNCFNLRGLSLPKIVSIDRTRTMFGGCNKLTYMEGVKFDLIEDMRLAIDTDSILKYL